MASAHKRFEGEVVSYLIAWIPDAVWSGQPIDPESINPWAARKPPTEKAAAFARWQSKVAWRSMLMSLKEQVERR